MMSLNMQSVWQRMILLVILGYESAGCLVGGSMLVAKPDGTVVSFK